MSIAVQSPQLPAVTGKECESHNRIDLAVGASRSASRLSRLSCLLCRQRRIGEATGRFP
jgi:hypothetical protein